MHRMNVIQLGRTRHGFKLSLSCTVQIWRSLCRGFKEQALYTRRENQWFCVVNTAKTTAKAPMGFLIIYFFSIIL